MTTHPLRWLGLILLCAIYIKTAIASFLDFAKLIDVLEGHNLLPAAPIAAALIFFLTFNSVLVLTGGGRWIGAIALSVFTLAASCIAYPFWSMSPGVGRAETLDHFLDHLGLVGGLLLVAWYDLHKWKTRLHPDWS
ncbi:DoxX family membrane protein [Rhizobium sp.]|uniref:DoxX family membrane protein n=1 Tax=Rhizobium sp. TaxID=391 RepID=UPI00289BB9BF